MNRRSASVSKSSNLYNNSTMTTTSRTESNKFGSTTRNTVTKVVTDKKGRVVGTTNQLQVSHSSSVTSGILGNTFGLLFGLLVLINLYSILSGVGEFRGLEWLLNVMSNAPSIDVSWLETWGKMSISDDWGAFQFLANFLNKFNEFLNLCAFLSIGCINILLFLLYFVGAFLFAGI